MPASEFICPHCLFKAPITQFDNIDADEMKCRRCRSYFKDPNAFSMGTTYADCDSVKTVTRFPFSLNGENALIRVRDGYLALLVGSGGQRLWLDRQDCRVTDVPGYFQVFYFCLSPVVTWGTTSESGFGAYGRARLNLSPDYIKAFCGMDGQVMELENYLKRIVGRRITEYVEDQLSRQNIRLLERRDGYLNLVGVLENGVNLTWIDPVGYMGENGRGTFISYAAAAPKQAEPAKVYTEEKASVEILKPGRSSYVIKDRVEEVFISGASNATRHKSGERVDDSLLKGVSKIIRFRTKEFSFPYGWGIYNQTSGASGFYSAQGTISFYIDSTALLSRLLAKTKSWQEFEDHFFMDVFRKEISAALRDVLNARAIRHSYRQDRIGASLSAMSLELTDYLNGEGSSEHEPVFRPYGLRVKRADILDINFYPDRR